MSSQWHPDAGKTNKTFLSTRAALLILAALVLIVIYYAFSPEDSRWFPRCPIKLVTGLDCPGCGGQRAFHAVLHGHFAAALRYNFFYIVGFPYLIAALLGALNKGRVSRWVNTHLLTPLAGWIYAGLYVGWFVIRNIYGL